MRVPTGKGMYLWNIERCGTPAQIVDDSLALGLSYLMIKVADGPYNYNMNTTGTFLSDSNLKILVSGLRQEEISPWGWQYVYLNDPVGEAKKAIEKINRLGLDGFVVNAEKEAKSKAASARLYMQTLREALPDFPIALSSYRYPGPKYHPEFPWREFLSRCDFNMPQVYWISTHNPAENLLESLKQFETLYKSLGFSRPIIPTGAAFSEHGWSATVQDLAEFHRTCLDLASKGKILASHNYWEFYPVKDTPEFAAQIMAQTWDVTPTPQPEPEPIPVPQITKIKVIVDRVNLRRAPQVTNNIIGNLYRDAVLDVKEIRLVSGNQWARVGDNLWVAMLYSGLKLAIPV